MMILNLLSHILVFACILWGMFTLFALSEKQFKKTQTSRWHKLTQSPKRYKQLAWLCFFAAGAILIVLYGSSVGFISWWIFATPITFALILSVNDLKQKSANKR